MVHTVELNWSKPLYHTPPPFHISQDAFCQMVCLQLCFNVFNLVYFSSICFNSTSIYNHSIPNPAPELNFGYVQICIESRVMIY